MVAAVPAGTLAKIIASELEIGWNAAEWRTSTTRENELEIKSVIMSAAIIDRMNTASPE
jgi:hypothetical protein